MNWFVIRLELAKSRGFPSGSAARAYLISLPLSAKGDVDAAELNAHWRRATVRRHWPSEPDQWGFARADADEIILRCNGHVRTLSFEARPIAVGGIANVGADGETALPFRIVDIKGIN